MRLTTIYGVLVELIDRHYPPAEFPAEHAFLREKYGREPYVTLALATAVDECLFCMTREARRHPRLSDDETQSMGLDRFLEIFAQTIHDEANSVFDGVEQL